MEQKEIIDFLESHPATKQWMESCRKNYTMDVPMMIVDAIQNFTSSKINESTNIQDYEIAQGALDYLKEVGSVDKKDIIFHDFQRGAIWYRSEIQKRK